MIFNKAGNISLILFSIFSFLMLITIFSAFRKSNISVKMYVSLLIYLVLISILVATGIAREHIFPVAPLIFVSILIFAISIAFSNSGALLVKNLRLGILVGFLSFRLPLEILLHHWVNIGTIPPTMTWTGQNWDIVSGIICALGAPFVEKWRTLAWVIQIVAFALLINVLRVVLMSSPFPFSWNLENPLQLILYFPYVLIGPLFVGSAFCCHLLIFGKLIAQRQSS